MFHVKLPDNELNISMILYAHLYNLSLPGTTFIRILLTSKITALLDRPAY